MPVCSMACQGRIYQPDSFQALQLQDWSVRNSILPLIFLTHWASTHYDNECMINHKNSICYHHAQNLRTMPGTSFVTRSCLYTEISHLMYQESNNDDSCSSWNNPQYTWNYQSTPGTIHQHISNNPSAYCIIIQHWTIPVPITTFETVLFVWLANRIHFCGFGQVCPC